jgi:hypothetical protein
MGHVGSAPASGLETCFSAINISLCDKKDNKKDDDIGRTIAEKFVM